MAYQVTISPRALRDVEVAYLHFAEVDSNFANAWIVELHEFLQSLSTFPERCGLANESYAFDKPLRQHIYGKGVGAYRVLFTVEEEEVRIHHIRHCRQRPLGPSEIDAD